MMEQASQLSHFGCVSDFLHILCTFTQKLNYLTSYMHVSGDIGWVGVGGVPSIMIPRDSWMKFKNILYNNNNNAVATLFRD